MGNMRFSGDGYVDKDEYGDTRSVEEKESEARENAFAIFLIICFVIGWIVYHIMKFIKL